MEFNPDGSLKVAGPDKDEQTQASITVKPLEGHDEGATIVVELLDGSLPYNLVEGQFHHLNTSTEIQCDARLGKHSENMYDIVVTGPAYEQWIDKFVETMSDFLDDRVQVQRE